MSQSQSASALDAGLHCAPSAFRGSSQCYGVGRLQLFLDRVHTVARQTRRSHHSDQKDDEDSDRFVESEILLVPGDGQVHPTFNSWTSGNLGAQAATEPSMPYSRRERRRRFA